MESALESWMGNSNDRERNITPFMVFYSLISLVFIFIGPHMFSSNWISSSDFHACIEISSSFIAFIAAMACLMYYFGKNNRYFLIIGLGFFVCGSEDLIHGIFGFKRLFVDSGVDFTRFIPGTYVAGRSMLAIMIIAAALLETMLKTTERVRREAVIFSAIAILLGSGATVLAFTLPLPKFIYPGNLISRPVDFISAVLFFVAFLLIMKRYLVHRDIFSGMLLACILLNIGGQVYMSFSKQLFDVFFDTAHWANILSYCMPVTGISIEFLYEMKRSNQEIMERKKVEDSLRITQMEYAQIFNATSPLCAIDNDCNIIRANKSFFLLFDIRTDEAEGKKCHEIIKAPICNTDQCLLKQVKERGGALGSEGSFKIGETFVHINAVPYRDSDGELIGITETIIDDTERKVFEDNSKKQDWLKTGQTEINDRMRSEQDIAVLGRNIITFLAEYLNAQIGAIYLAGDKNHLSLIGSYAYKKRKNLSNKFMFGEGLVGQAALEKENITLTDVPDGYIAVSSGLGEAVPNNIIVLPFMLDNEVKGVIELGSFYEFSDRILDFLNQVSENIAIAIHSAQSRQQMHELLEKTQAQSEELQTKQEELRQSNEELEEQTMALKESKAGLQSQQEELRQTNEELEEQTRLLEAQKVDIKKKNMELEKSRSLIEEKAKDLEITGKYKSEFLANMSHELRTPLNSILLLSKLLSDNKDRNLTEKQVEFAEIIQGSGSDLLNLINEILDLSKVESGKMELHLEDVTLQDIADTMKRNFKSVARENKLNLNIDVAQDLPTQIRTDQQRLDQVIKNLLSNAFKFTSQGSVTLKIGRPASGIDLSKSGLDPAKTIALSVFDTGIGIAKEKQQVIFEAFQQADGTTSRKFGGTGLGLSISRELAGFLDGELQLDSEVGKGSTFTLYIPETLDGVQKAEGGTGDERRGRKDEKLSTPKEELGAGKEAQVSNKEYIPDDRKEISAKDKFILIIEDDPEYARILRNLSREKGFKTIVAENGETGLHFADYYRPCAIILDIGLPGMDGWAVMSRLKNNMVTRHIPVHFISAFDKSHEAMKMGAIGYLTKPLNMEKLEQVYEKIEHIISNPVKKLLLVEDDKAQRKAVVELIGSKDVLVTGVSTGREANELLASENFDCMILDLGLPDMSGIELLSMMKNEDALLHMPVIVYTGKELTKQEKTILDEYAESIIIKDAKSPERLLDETTLFLHSVEDNLPEEKREMLRMIHDKESILKDKKVLLVDDDMRNVFALTNILEDKGIKVLVGKNGKEAIERLNENPDLDLALMDIMMPEMDGYEATGKIRNQGRFKKLPIIALTAKAMKGDRAKCIEAGANDYLAKPVDTDKLLSMLRVWLY